MSQSDTINTTHLYTKPSNITKYTNNRPDYLYLLSKIATPDNYDTAMLLLEAYNNLYNDYITHLEESCALYDEYMKLKLLTNSSKEKETI